MGTLLSGEGRSNRSVWWLTHLVTITGLYLVGLVTCAVLTSDSTTHEIQTLMLPAALVIAILMIWTLTAVCVRRLHDFGWSGLWLGLALIPVFGQVWFVYVLGIKSGHGAANEFGEAPPALADGLRTLKRLINENGRLSRRINCFNGVFRGSDG
ncbi:MAG: DUF805 domain-containing protein [Pseudomonadota bacterium]